MFYDRYVTLCKDKGISLSKAAAEIGLNKASVTNWKKNGYTPRADVLQRIADYFGVSMSSLMGGENSEKAPAPQGKRAISDDDLKAAFWGGERDLTPEELDEMWEDVREYARYKAEQRRKKKQE